MRYVPLISKFNITIVTSRNIIIALVIDILHDMKTLVRHLFYDIISLICFYISAYPFLPNIFLKEIPS